MKKFKRYILKWTTYGADYSEKYHETEMVEIPNFGPGRTWQPMLVEKYRIVEQDSTQYCVFFAKNDAEAEQIASKNIKIIEISNPLYRPNMDQEGRLVEFTKEGKERTVANLAMKHLENTDDWFLDKIKSDIYGCHIDLMTFLEECNDRSCPCCAMSFS